MHQLRSLARKIADRAGRRGAILFVLGVIDLLYGTAITTTLATWSPTVLTWWPVSQTVVLYIPTAVWGVIWICVGAFLLVGVFFKHDRVFYAAEVFLKTSWGLAAMFYFFQGGLGLWGVAVIHSGFAVLALIAAGWKELPPLPPTIFLQVGQDDVE